MSDSLWPHGLYSPWNSPGQNTWVGSLSLLQGIFLTQGSNSGLPHCRWILYELSYEGSPHNHELIIYNKSLSLCISLYILPIGSDSLERSLVPYVILWEGLWTIRHPTPLFSTWDTWTSHWTSLSFNFCHLENWHFWEWVLRCILEECIPDHAFWAQSRHKGK